MKHCFLILIHLHSKPENPACQLMRLSDCIFCFDRFYFFTSIFCCWLSFVLFAPPFFGIVQLSHPILFFFFRLPPPLIEANLLQCTFYLLGYSDISIFPRFCISESVSQYFISAFYIFLVLFSFLVFSVYSLHPFCKEPLYLSFCQLHCKEVHSKEKVEDNRPSYLSHWIGLYCIISHQYLHCVQSEFLLGI